MIRRLRPGRKDVAAIAPEAGTRRIRLAPGYAVLVGFLLLLGMIGSLHAPIDGTFGALDGGVAPRPGMPPRCLALAYAAPGDFRWMPNEIRLTPAVDFAGRDGTWYRAFERDGWRMVWRPAGRDSLDITGHHKPVLRLPARGAHRVGRGGWPGYSHIWEAMTSREWRVEAREIACARG